MRGVRISPDRKRIAYIAGFPRDSNRMDAICIEPAGKSGHEIIRMELEYGIASDLRWSPDGAHLACCLHDPGTTPCMPLGIAWMTPGWDPSGTMQLAGQTPGMSYAWIPATNSLAVASSAFMRIVSTQDGSEKKIADLYDDGDPLFPPRIAVSPDGNRIAYTTRRTDENISRVWIAARNADRWVSTLLTTYPGAFASLSPFWSPDSATLGLHIVHPKMERSEIVLFPNLAGEGEIVYRNHLLNPGHEPSYVPSGSGIIFYHTSQPRNKQTKTGPALLALLSLRGIHPAGMHILTGPSDNKGWPRFIDPGHLALEGGSSACLLNLPLWQNNDHTETGGAGRSDDDRFS